MMVLWSLFMCEWLKVVYSGYFVSDLSNHIYGCAQRNEGFVCWSNLGLFGFFTFYFSTPSSLCFAHWQHLLEKWHVLYSCFVFFSKWIRGIFCCYVEIWKGGWRFWCLPPCLNLRAVSLIPLFCMISPLLFFCLVLLLFLSDPFVLLAHSPDL